MKNLLLFDVDGTITESGEKIKNDMASIMNYMKTENIEIGIVGGGQMDKITKQLDDKICFDHYFTECGCVYIQSIDKSLFEIYTKNIREHNTYPAINILIKTALNFLSQVDYTITGNFIDLRNGIIYVSLIGLSANSQERQIFMELDKTHQYRQQLLSILHNKARDLDIIDKVDIVEGGRVGIAIYPTEYDKIQVLESLSKDEYHQIYYFGDKYGVNGNDYQLINSDRVIGVKVDSLDDTMEFLKKLTFDA